jgi:hypothetical protein
VLLGFRLAISLAALPALVAAQSRDSLAVLEGHVRDAVDSGAVAYAEVRIDNGRQYARADGHGRYRIAGITPGHHEITYRILGYTPIQLKEMFVAGQSMTRDLYLARMPRLLTAMDVKGKSLRVPAGFEAIYQRAARGQGFFVTREQIDSLNPRDVLGTLHHFTSARAGYTQSGKINRIESQRCEEFAILLNGTPITANLYAVEEVLRSTSPGWIQAIEVYDNRARIPVEFQPACGVVAVWTRTR